MDLEGVKREWGVSIWSTYMYIGMTSRVNKKTVFRNVLFAAQLWRLSEQSAEAMQLLGQTPFQVLDIWASSLSEERCLPGRALTA